MNTLSLVRKAACAGSWYEANSNNVFENVWCLLILLTY